MDGKVKVSEQFGNCYLPKSILTTDNTITINFQIKSGKINNEIVKYSKTNIQFGKEIIKEKEIK